MWYFVLILPVNVQLSYLSLSHKPHGRKKNDVYDYRPDKNGRQNFHLLGFYAFIICAKGQNDAFFK